MILPVPLRLGIVVIGSLLLQVTLVRRLELGGVSGDLLVVLPVAAGLHNGSEHGAMVGFATGLALDTMLSTPLGLTALVFTLVGYAAGPVGENMIRASRAAAAVLAGLAAVAATFGFVLGGVILGQTQLLTVPVLWIAAVSSLVAAVASFWIVPLVRWALDDPRNPVRAVR